MTVIVTDEQAKRALEWLTYNNEVVAEARSNRSYLEELTKHLKASFMSESRQDTVSAREQEALADPRYKIHLDGLKVAIKEDERMRALVSLANTKIEVWRTEQANARNLAGHFAKSVPE